MLFTVVLCHQGHHHHITTGHEAVWTEQSPLAVNSPRGGSNSKVESERKSTIWFQLFFVKVPGSRPRCCIYRLFFDLSSHSSSLHSLHSLHSSLLTRSSLSLSLLHFAHPLPSQPTPRLLVHQLPKGTLATHRATCTKGSRTRVSSQVVPCSLYALVCAATTLCPCQGPWTLASSIITTLNQGTGLGSSCDHPCQTDPTAKHVGTD